MRWFAYFLLMLSLSTTLGMSADAKTAPPSRADEFSLSYIDKLDLAIFIKGKPAKWCLPMVSLRVETGNETLFAKDSSIDGSLSKLAGKLKQGCPVMQQIIVTGNLRGRTAIDLYGFARSDRNWVFVRQNNTTVVTNQNLSSNHIQNMVPNTDGLPQTQLNARPSFDCSQARQSSEQLICREPILASLDAELGRLFQQVYSVTDSVQKRALVQAQKSWVWDRNRCENNASCIEQSYRNRIATLNAHAGHNNAAWGVRPVGKNQRDVNGVQNLSDSQLAVTFAKTPEPDYKSLLHLWMAANADILDSDIFAWENYLTFYIPPESGQHNRNGSECKKLEIRRNEFDEQRLLQHARQILRPALVQARNWPRKRFFKIRKTIKLGRYNGQQGRFIVSNSFSSNETKTVQRDSKLCQFRLGIINDNSINQNLIPGSSYSPSFSLIIQSPVSLDHLPMEPARAEYYTRIHGNDRQAEMEALVEVGPVFVSSDNSYSGQVAARIVAARILEPRTRQILHIFPPALFVPTMNQTTASNGLPGNIAQSGIDQVTLASFPFTRYRQGLLLLKHNQSILSEKILNAMTTDQIAYEQRYQREEVDKKLESDEATQYGRRGANSHIGRFIYEWQALVRTHPDLANGPILKLFASPKPDWSFLAQHGFDTRRKNVVEAFLFRQSDIRNRQADFVARELKPVFSTHLLQAATLAENRYHVIIELPEIGYDFDKKVIKFKGGSGFSSHCELASKPNHQQQPKDSFGTTLYLARSLTALNENEVYSSQSEETNNKISEAGPMKNWRGLVSQFFGQSGQEFGEPIIVFDRELALEQIPIGGAKAEAILGMCRSKNTHLRAKINFEINNAKVSSVENGGKVGVFFAQLHSIEILMPDNTIIHVFQAEEFQKTVEGLFQPQSDGSVAENNQPETFNGKED